MVSKLLQDNVERLPDRFAFSGSFSAGLANFGVQQEHQSDPGTRASAAVVIAQLLADQVVRDFDYEGPISYLAGQSQLVLSSLEDSSQEFSGAVTLFADLLSPEGKRIAVCLFGSGINVCDCEPNPPQWRKFAWTSSTNNDV